MVRLSSIKTVSKLFMFRNFNKIQGPKLLTIFPTSRCNMRCPMCPFDHDDIKELEIGLVKKILEDGHKMGVKMVRFSGGGEPLSYPHIEGLLKLCKEKYKFQTGMTTNGTLLTKTRAELMVDLGHDEVTVSIDAPEKSAYEKIRGKGNFKLLLKNMETLRKIKEERNSQLPEMGINNVLMKNTVDYAEGMVHFAAERGFSRITFAPMLIEGWGDKKLAVPENRLDQIIELLSGVKETADEKNIQTNLGSILRIGEEALKRDIEVKSCYAPWNQVYVNHEGKVYFCCFLYKYVLGDIREKSLREHWEGEAFSSARRNFKKGRLYPECRMCNPFMVESSKKVEKFLNPFNFFG